MSTRRPRPYAARAIAVVAVLGGLLLAGCSDDEPAPDADEPTASTTAPGPSESAEPTDAPSSSEELPESFPVDEVPIIDGEIGEVLENPGLGSYLIKVYPDTDFATAFADATFQLVDAGFQQGKDVISAGPTSSTADFASDDWTVVVTGGLPDRTLVQYTVYPAE